MLTHSILWSTPSRSVSCVTIRSSSAKRRASAIRFLMAARAGTGIELDLSLVPQREQNMTAYEMLLSESQERMLIVAHAGREREVVDIFRKWDLDAVVIGRVREGGHMRVRHNGETV